LIFNQFMLELGVASTCVLLLVLFALIQMQTDRYGVVVNRIYKKTIIILQSRDKVH
jgi:hypothetical protein